MLSDRGNPPSSTSMVLRCFGLNPALVGERVVAVTASETLDKLSLKDRFLARSGILPSFGAQLGQLQQEFFLYRGGYSSVG